MGTHGVSSDGAQAGCEGPEARARTVGLSRHSGPLRVLRSLYPEGPSVCHHVLVHPPGGLAGGDRLDIDIHLEPRSHAVLTTPGATRFYRSLGEEAEQVVQAQLKPGSRLEWLPMESIVYNGARSANVARFELHGDARLIAWDVLALGLPASEEPWLRGQHRQRLEVAGLWLDHAQLDASDHGLLHSPVGWHGHTVLATLLAASGSAVASAELTRWQEAAWTVIGRHALSRAAGVTALADQRGLVLRALAHRVEPAMDLLKQVWTAWRPSVMGLAAQDQRLWRT